jgi:magnesium-transporting ATPase (P-type)
MCTITAILFGIYSNVYPSIANNTQQSGISVPVDSILIFFSYLVLLNTMIPISLIVSIEIVKMSQSHFINKDNLMYSEFRKKPVNVKTASLNEELGQI